MTSISNKNQNSIIGIIGMGDMGRLYAKRLSDSGNTVYACDREENYKALLDEFKDSKIKILENGHMVSRISDFIIYSVEAENINTIVKQYANSTKVGAIVGGQTSCKEVEIATFEKYLPSDTEIISVHSLHGPKVDPKGQPLAIIPHRVFKNTNSLEYVENLMKSFESKIVILSYKEHDKITADTQAATHAAFLSMGGAWKANNQFPWYVSRYAAGIENVKINISLRIYSNKWHVYAGLAISNPAAHKQIVEYATSTTQLFNLMLEGNKEKLRERLYHARRTVFKIDDDDFITNPNSKPNSHAKLLLSDEILDQFSLSKVPFKERTPNSQLSLLAMGDCWCRMGIIPYDHMICSTPLFRVWLGVTEYLFLNKNLLDDAINTGISDHSFRADDLEFTFCARNWADIVSNMDYVAYKKKFVDIQNYFKPRFEEANKVGNAMLKTIFDHTKHLEK